MISRIFTGIYGILAYVYFLWIFPQMLGFVVRKENFPEVVSGLILYSPEQHADNEKTIIEAFGINLGLALLFGFSHTILARETMKKIIPLDSLYRSTYVAVACAEMHFMLANWQVFPESSDMVLWSVPHSICLLIFGSVFLLSATFVFDHFELVGLKQSLQVDMMSMIGCPVKGEFRSICHYKYCRHPMMFGMLLIFWGSPKMTLTLAMWSLSLSIYVLVAVKFFEEKDLIREFGKSYIEYSKKCPMFIPNFFSPYIPKNIEKKK